MPSDQHAVPAHDRSFLRGQELLVGLVGHGTMPDVHLLVAVIGDILEAVEDPAVVRVQTAHALCHQPFADGVEEVMIDLKRLLALFLAGVVQRLVHVAQDRRRAVVQLLRLAFGVGPLEQLGGVDLQLWLVGIEGGP
jgi:hypothetical protein